MTRSTVRLWSALAVWALAAVCGLAGNSHASTQTPATPLDQKYQDTNPNLYAIARKYFPSDVNEVAPRRVFRLTRDQIDLSVATLLPRYVTRSVKEVMPKDPLQTNYEYAEILNFNSANISGLSGWIRELAAAVRKEPSGVIDCPDKASDCLKVQARAFVLKAFRGDVGDDRLEKITSFVLESAQANGMAQAASELVEIVLNSPDFLFRKELDLDKSSRLAPQQLLQALTYTIADAPPEKLNLQSHNASQYLKSGSDARATLNAIGASKESREKLVRFFMAWLEVKEPAEFTISPATFPEFKPPLAAAMVDETRQFLRAALSKPAPKLKDITQATQSYVPKALEPVYGTKAADASGSKPVTLDPTQRLGIFSQPAVLASHSGPTDTRPIKRGVFWVRKAMCMELEPAPKDLHAKLYEMVAKTERQRIEKSTRQSACIGCHKVINPFAFFQESYDALGRWRTTDNGQPIDPAIDINFLDEGPSTAETPVDAIRTLTSSAMFKQCFVRQLFRFYVGRQEEPADDPLLRRLFFEFAGNDQQDIVNTIQMLASSNRLVRRQ